MENLKGKVAIITGASRGIGKAIALKLAAQGVNIAVGAKTVKSTPKTPGTIFDTAREVEALGAQALAVQTDVRFEDQIAELVRKTYERFGRIDIVVNNAGAILWLPVEELPVKRFDLMMQLNCRAPFILCHEAIPLMKESGSGHVINMSPPLDWLPVKAWAGKTAYMMSKLGMTHLTLGLAEEVRKYGIAVNSLWPAGIVDTQATRVFASMLGIDESVKWYSPEMVADAVLEIVGTPPDALTGQRLIVEEFLRSRGYGDLSGYEVEPPVAGSGPTG